MWEERFETEVGGSTVSDYWIGCTCVRGCVPSESTNELVSRSWSGPNRSSAGVICGCSSVYTFNTEVYTECVTRRRIPHYCISAVAYRLCGRRSEQVTAGPRYETQAGQVFPIKFISGAPICQGPAGHTFSEGLIRLDGRFEAGL